jgi:hypothetical protein
MNESLPVPSDVEAEADKISQKNALLYIFGMMLYKIGYECFVGSITYVATGPEHTSISDRLTSLKAILRSSCGEATSDTESWGHFMV